MSLSELTGDHCKSCGVQFRSTKAFERLKVVESLHCDIDPYCSEPVFSHTIDWLVRCVSCNKENFIPIHQLD